MNEYIELETLAATTGFIAWGETSKVRHGGQLQRVFDMYADAMIGAEAIEGKERDNDTSAD